MFSCRYSAMAKTLGVRKDLEIPMQNLSILFFCKLSCTSFWDPLSLPIVIIDLNMRFTDLKYAVIWLLRLITISFLHELISLKCCKRGIKQYFINDVCVWSDGTHRFILSVSRPSLLPYSRVFFVLLILVIHILSRSHTGTVKCLVENKVASSKLYLMKTFLFKSIAKQSFSSSSVTSLLRARRPYMLLCIKILRHAVIVHGSVYEDGLIYRCFLKTYWNYSTIFFNSQQ